MSFKKLRGNERKGFSAMCAVLCVLTLLSIYPRRAWQMPIRQQELYPGITPHLAGYDKVADVYIPINEDPQLLFTMDGRTVSTIRVIFSEGLKSETPVQVYYAVEGGTLQEENSVTALAMPGDREIVMAIPTDVYTLLRLDINGSMKLAGVDTSPDVPKEYERLSVRWQQFLGYKLLIMTVALYWGLRRVRPRETLVEVRVTPGDGARGGPWPMGRWRPDPGQVIQALIIVAVFAFSLTLAMHMPTELAPDEAMRDDVPLWIFQNGSLPVGDEQDLVNPIWGFSYAFSPYLTSLLALPLMCVLSLFGGPDGSLLLAMRLVSVFAATGSTALCFPIGKRVFRRKETVYLFAVLVGFLPQFIFCGSYFNNDAFSLFTVFLILYFLLRGRENHWDTKSCVGLGVALSLCILTYYFAYGWVLLSVPFCVVSVLRDKTIEKKGTFLLRRICLVAALVFCLAGWYFIRNACLYDGDFLALSASGKCAAAYEQATGISVYHPPLLAATGVGLGEMLFDMGWIKTTLRSLVGGFGYMSIFLSEELYGLYDFLVIAGILCGLYRFIKRPGHVLNLCLLSLGAVIPFLFSIYFSYTSGYQPQGRYVISALPTLALLTALGYEQASVFMARHRRIHRVSITCPEWTAPVTFTVGANPTVMVTLLWLALFAWVWTTVMVPQLLGS